MAVTDRLLEGVDQATGHSPTAAATLSSLAQFLPSPSIGRLAEVVGLSHSGTVRLVDRLEGEGLVSRSAGVDARSVTVSLTAAGRRAAGRIRQQRLTLIESLVETLDDGQRGELDELLGRLLVALMRPPGATGWTCRLCDLGACGRPEGRCPIEQEARIRYGQLPR